ncbi:hypothetical protein GQ457_16G000450 [Hibiscus cannabinus]
MSVLCSLFSVLLLPCALRPHPPLPFVPFLLYCILSYILFTLVPVLALLEWFGCHKFRPGKSSLFSSLLSTVNCQRTSVGEHKMAATAASSDNLNDGLTLQMVRDSLIRQEDTIVFSLIERARFPLNSPAYDPSTPGLCASLVEFFVQKTEALQATAGRYENPEEHPFFPDNLPPSLVPHFKYPEVLHPAAMSINMNKVIWDMYFNKLLPLFVAPGDDGNYASTAASDLECLQAISRRIHYGKLVAEVKFRNEQKDYEPPIRAQDRNALASLLTFADVEEAVKKRVAKKAMTFGQEVKLGDNGDKGKYKVDPAVVSGLYGDWVIPLTKEVEIEYLLRRLD